MRIFVLAGVGLAASLGVATTSALGDGFSEPTDDQCFDKGVNDYVPCEEPVLVGPWTGPYAGLHLGVVGADWDGSIDVPEREKFDIRLFDRNQGPWVWSEKWNAYGFDLSDLSDSGFGVGGHLGYNHQTQSHWVFGVEGDFTFLSGVSGSVGAATDFAVTTDKKGYSKIGGVLYDVPQPYAQIETDIDWLASMRVRAGRAFGDLMPFVTAGVGFANYSVSGDAGLHFGDRGNGDYVLSQFSGAEDGVAVGPVFGGGLEYMITPSMTLRGEALYYVFNEEIDTSTWVRDELNDEIQVENSSLELEDVLVGRIALSVRF